MPGLYGCSRSLHAGWHAVKLNCRGIGHMTVQDHMEAILQERVAIFIDGSNLYNGMRENLSNTRVNLLELMNQLKGSRRLVRTYYYNAQLTDDYDGELRSEERRVGKEWRARGGTDA